MYEGQEVRLESQGHGKFLLYFKKNWKPVRDFEQGLTGSNLYFKMITLAVVRRASLVRE